MSSHLPTLRDGWLSWPCWLTDSGRLNHKVVIHPASSLALDREISRETSILTTMLRRQLIYQQSWSQGLVPRRICRFIPHSGSRNYRQSHCPSSRRVGQAELAWVDGYIAKWFTCWKAVTHPATNWAERR